MSNVIFELKHFGVKQTYYHALSKIQNRKTEKYITKYLIEREKLYNTMDQDELIHEIKINYERIQGVSLDYKEPKRFTEKIQWMIAFDNIPQKSMMADKLLVRKWIEDKIGSQYLIPFIGAWERFEEIDFDRMPNSFCLKMNHGSAMNYLVKNKAEFNYTEARNLFEWWLIRPFWATTLELQYRTIKPMIVAEKYIEEMTGGLNDYKIHCFNGEPLFIQCIGDRDIRRHIGYQKNYDLQWNELDWTFADYPDFPYEVLKPKCLDEMLWIAKKLCESFLYVRIDLYEVEGHVLFGEMTFTPSSGIYPYKDRWNETVDVQLGGKLSLLMNETKEN